MIQSWEMKVNLKEKKLRLGKCKLDVDFGRFKITFIFINLRGLKIKTDDEDYVDRGTLPRQAIPYLLLYICNKTWLWADLHLQALDKVVNKQM